MPQCKNTSFFSEIKTLFKKKGDTTIHAVITALKAIKLTDRMSTLESRHNAEMPVLKSKTYRYGRTSLSVGQCVMMMLKKIATCRRHCVQLMVLQFRKLAARSLQGTVKLIVGPIHPIDLHDSTQATLVKHLVVCHQGQSFNQRSHLGPHLGEHIGRVGIVGSQAMHTAAEPSVIIGFRLNETVETIRHRSITDDDNTHAADAGRAFVSRLKIYGCKVSHGILAYLFFIMQKQNDSLHKINYTLKNSDIRMAAATEALRLSAVPPRLGMVRVWVRCAATTSEMPRDSLPMTRSAGCCRVLW